MKNKNELRVAELFAGVGGFRAGLEAASTGFTTKFSNQWEPPGTPARQFASKCYQMRFGSEGHYNEDIAEVLNRVSKNITGIGSVDLLVGGFPCQDYSVAKPLNQSDGLVGKKGVLWWQIHRLLRLQERDGKLPRWVLLENVDRLLKSPASHRGRDFAIMLASLDDLGYDVEWRVINAADYGFAQRRRRVFIVGYRREEPRLDGTSVIFRNGILARAFNVVNEGVPETFTGPHFVLKSDLSQITRDFDRGIIQVEFLNAGFISGRRVWTYGTRPAYEGPRQLLGDVLVEEHLVPEEFFVTEGALAKWKYLKGAKNEPRVHKSGGRYFYTEGALPFPDPIDRPSRTILTSEGGASPSRSKHVVSTSDGRLRRLLPVELEVLNGFEPNWTDVGLTNNQRAFCMGNALVVGVVERIARVIAKESGLRLRRTRPALIKQSQRSKR